MKVLAACESSGRVRDAFRERGHDAWSCDILPSISPSNFHIQDDVLNHLEGWDMIIAFPPCTHLSKISAAKWKSWQADGTQASAIKFFMTFINADCPKICVENPAGIMSRKYRKPDQYIQPFWFGHPFLKQTGLWLKKPALASS